MTTVDGTPWLRPLDLPAALLVAAASAWAFLAFRSAPGTRAVVYLEDRRYGWFDLGAEPGTLEIATRIGKVRVAIGNGEARVLASPCPGQRCVHAGAVRRVRGEIACAPARLFIEVEGDAPGGVGKGPDAVTY